MPSFLIACTISNVNQINAICTLRSVILLHNYIMSQIPKILIVLIGIKTLKKNKVLAGCDGNIISFGLFTGNRFIFMDSLNRRTHVGALTPSRPPPMVIPIWLLQLQARRTMLKSSIRNYINRLLQLYE